MDIIRSSYDHQECLPEASAAGSPLLLDSPSFVRHEGEGWEGEEEEGLGRYNVKVYELGKYREVVHLRRGWGGAKDLPLMAMEQDRRERELRAGRASADHVNRRFLPPGMAGEGRAEGRPSPKREGVSEGARRAKTRVRRLALKYDLGHMWTLTHKDPDFSDLRGAWNAWKLFTLRMRRAKLMPDEWIVVPELQQGRVERYGDWVWHFHMVTNRFIEWKRFSDTWGRGYCWVSPERDPEASARYISKYVAKSFEDEEDLSRPVAARRQPGQHRYRAARGMGAEGDSRYVETTELYGLLTEGDLHPIGHCPITEGETVLGDWYLCRRSRPS